jgi:hypothetical protein
MFKNKIFIEFSLLFILNFSVSYSQIIPNMNSNQYIPEGVEKDFDEKIEDYKVILFDYLNIDTLSMCSDTEYLDKIHFSLFDIANNNLLNVDAKKQLLKGLLAYFGDIIKKEKTGKWKLYLTKDGRYFPQIISNIDKTYDFFGYLDNYINEIPNSNLNLNQIMNIILSNFQISTEPFSDWFFPPLETD